MLTRVARNNRAIVTCSSRVVSRFNSSSSNNNVPKEEDLKNNPTQLRKLLSNLFSPSPTATDSLSQFYRKNNLDRLSGSSRLGDDNSTADDAQKFIEKHPFATNVLYIHSLGISLDKSDFERLLPAKGLQAGHYVSSSSIVDFELVKSRNPHNLTPWFGYYLIFNSKEDAVMYYQETLGAELCGLQLKLRFADPATSKGIDSPILDKTKDIDRKMCALILGLPDDIRPLNILRALWDYDFIDDDSLAVEKLPTGRIRYGGSPYLLRFKNEEEPQRLVREFNRRVFPHTESEIYVEIVD